MLPSNACWYNTGLDVKEDEECLVRVTGNVHLAFNKLYRDVDNDKIPIIKWTGPEGNEWANIKDGSACAKAKRSLLIKPGNTIGNVVGYLNNEDKTDKDFIGYFLKNRQRITLDVEDVNRQKIMKTEKKGTSTLYLCVNDILLDLTSPEQTQLSKDAFEGRDKNVSEWNSLEQQPEYYRLWFDDNIGGFLVSVTIRKKS